MGTCFLHSRLSVHYWRQIKSADKSSISCEEWTKYNNREQFLHFLLRDDRSPPSSHNLQTPNGCTLYPYYSAFKGGLGQNRKQDKGIIWHTFLKCLLGNTMIGLIFHFFSIHMYKCMQRSDRHNKILLQKWNYKWWMMIRQKC